MKRILALFIGLFLYQAPASAQVRDMNLGISISDGRLRGFYFAIGDYYQVPPMEVVQFRDHYRCPDEDLPVVYFLAARAHVAPAAIISLRMGRMSWLDIAFHYRLTPDIFFVPVEVQHVGPPYGNAYGYYRKYGPSKQWRKVVLTDREVVDLVNLRFMSEHYRMAPESVMAMRSRGTQFTVINEDIRNEKAHGKPEKQQSSNAHQNGKGNGNQNGQGNGKKKR